MNRVRPVFSLAFLAPFIAEFLFGATPLSRIAGFIFLALLYGGGAVVIRELVRRRSPGGWGRIAVLGVAYAFIEEGLVTQSFFNPTLFRAGEIGGRAMGVNFVWTEWTVGYHILWSLLIPIALTELLFPEHRSEPWLTSGGLVAAGVCYVVGVAVIAMAFRRTVAPDFRAPQLHLILTVLAAFVLAVLALVWPVTPASSVATARPGVAPSVWWLAAVMLVTTAGWFGLLFLPEVLKRGARVLIPMCAAVALAAGGSRLVENWSTALGWSDRHRLAMVLGALPVTMLFGFFIVTAGSRIDQMGQAVGCLITAVLLISFAGRVRKRNPLTSIHVP